MYKAGIHYTTRDGPIHISPLKFALESEDDVYSLGENKHPFRENLERLVRGNTVVEIGPSTSLQHFLLDFDPKKYVCIEASKRQSSGWPDNVEYINNTDAVTYLDGIPDSSVVVVSSLIFDNDILIDKEYARKLIELIYCKTIPNGLTLHTFKDGFEKNFLEAGFGFVFGRHHSKVLTPDDIRTGYSKKLNLEVATIFFDKS